jgi:AraC-like DNA-binding protein
MAFSIGFTDPAYSSSFFRLHVGQSPSKLTDDWEDKGRS